MPADLKAVLLVGSLQKYRRRSRTQALAEMVAEELKRYGVEATLFYLEELNISTGVALDRSRDDMGKVAAAIEASDIVLFATPIWWNQPSSQLQKVIERMTGYDDEYIESDHSALYGKVFGAIVTGTDDGFQSCMSRFYTYATQLGMTVPPESFATWAEEDQEEEPGKIRIQIRANRSTMSMVKIMARNLQAWARVLKQSNIGSEVQEIKINKLGILAK